MADAVAIDIQQGADGSVVIDLETRRSEPKAASGRFDANLADSLPDDALGDIANQLLEGIEADKRSRLDWLNNYNTGMQLLGLMLEQVAAAGEGKTISRVRHPLLLWSIIKFQSLTQGEMLPASGPAKIRNDGDLSNEIAADLEKCFNRYLTTTASEYYPDTDRSLFYLGYGGTIFKKVYKCPIRRRPVSEFIPLPDLIVSQDAIDLTSALRVTHQIEMTHQQVRRYQKMKYWVDIDLPQPSSVVTSTDQAESSFVTGVSATRERQADWPHTIYESYTTLDLSEWIKEKGQDEGIELPYRVTIDADSRTVLEVRRNWRKDDPTWQPRKRFVKWGLIPGIGFLCLGYLHLLGNHTKALTALERIIIDSGMFANFPSGVRTKGTRMEKNVIQPGPGEFPEIDTGGLPINQAIMALPFKGPDETMLSLLQGLEAQGEKTAGQVEIKTGEGIADVPVGTIMAMIEQSTQVMTAVHRRLHQAQGEELILLRELLVEEPSLLQIPGATPKWTAEQLASASLVPASNPNVPAHIHRIMQAVVLETLSTNHPELYNAYEVQRRILEIAKISNPETVLLPPGTPTGDGAQDPTLVLGMLQAQIAQLQLNLRKQTDERNAALKAAELQLKAKETDAKLGLEAKALDQERQGHLEDLADKAADRQSKEQTSQFAQTSALDQAAQDRAAQMDIERLDRVIAEKNRQEDRTDAQAATASSVAEADKDRTIDIAKTTVDKGFAAKQHEDSVGLQEKGLAVKAAGAKKPETKK